ncbi:MAG: T9SS type A sorting domain-containing protein [Bacteroidota bacterium]
MSRTSILLLLIFMPRFTYGQECDETIKKIGESSLTSYVMYTANNGDLYYVNVDVTGFLDLLKYDVALDSVIKVSDSFIDRRPNSSGSARNGGFGSIAPTVTGDTVYCMTTAGSGSGYADIFRLVCSEDKLEHVTQICGEAYWMIFNLTLSRDGKSLYYISNNASVAQKGLYKVDIDTKSCNKVLELGDLLPDKDLCFGGINVWDDFNNFYLPVWSYSPLVNDPNDNDLAVLKIHVDGDQYAAEEIWFTEDGTRDGTPLLPGFRNHSCWSGIGASSNGNIYIAASNHYQSSDGTGEHGNVAIYKYDPVAEEMTFLNDLQSVSESVNNWMEGESQHKVHTFLFENSDGKIYFASDDYYPSHFIRGSHLYTIEVETDEVSDYSKSQPCVMRRDFSVIENGDEPGTTSGVFAEYYGLKGISLNGNAPDYLYAMTFANPDGVAERGNVIIYNSGQNANAIGLLNSHRESFEVGVYPNPSNGIVHFDFSELPSSHSIQIRIYDMLGQEIFRQTAVESDHFLWNGTSGEGGELASGFYLYSIDSDAGESISQGRIILIK